MLPFLLGCETNNGSAVLILVCFGSGGSTCSLCPPGSFSNTAGSFLCSSCLPGQYQPVGEATGCLDCPRGLSQPLFNATTCVACAPGKFSNATGSRQCFECPAGSYALRARCVLCTDQPGLDCSRISVAVHRGYWAYTDAMTGEWAAVECPVDRCPGSPNISAQCSDLGAGTNRDTASDNALCGRCLPDFADVGGRCVCKSFQCVAS